MNSKIIFRALKDAQKNKRFIGATIRLKKNGRFTKINGQVYDLKLNRDGEIYVVIENQLGLPRQDGKKWQSVRLSNILGIRKDGFKF